MPNNYEGPLRVYRGGSWYFTPAGARVALRYGVTPGNRYDLLGVRIVRLVAPMQRVAEVTNAI